MRKDYVAGTALPSHVASAVNVLKMCRALTAAGHEVTLYACGRQQDAPGVFATFGVIPCFELVLRAPPALPLVKNLLYPLRVAWEMARRPPPDLAYGRHAHALNATFEKGTAPRVYQVHALPSCRARRWAEHRLFGHPRFTLLVAISRALADDDTAAMPKLAGRPVLVVHDAADPVPDPGPTPYPWPGRAGAPQLGYVGHLYPGKGMEMVAATLGLPRD